ncbi:hypothetical protein SAMD00019534_098420 [Acytostelium subglobosum LB1]|uniref:hypothetical protein n=1 Tax=Acytostelium subglobosum LB1 TaxID=1410327 RepID=UPI000644CCB9|nr:hypothetical protein SAMD00019534_098420 [Acytostelium subglobosum LB1]GAM26667.1 hypothetical protein SAMD00019534_098420 [Acytostelium subglobosum LB1]|eukprot:XP_012750328.1 hypothetical protein SAMD00019534_098420 [Acytostelium subglobosum LB1]
MLKFLNEMGALNLRFCSIVLKHCVTNDRVESVRYLLEVTKELDHTQKGGFDRAVQASIIRSATLGYLDILQSLLRVVPCDHRYSYTRKNLSREAAENGHLHIIEHLHKNNIGDGTLTSDEESIVIKLMNNHYVKDERIDLVEASHFLYQTPLEELEAALKRDDQSAARDILISQWDSGLSSTVWSSLSKLMIAFLSIHRSNHSHNISLDCLYQLVKHIKDGELSLEHGLEYLRMATFVEPDESGDGEFLLKRSSLNWAASISLELLQCIQGMTSLEYDNRCLDSAIEHNRLDVILYLLANNWIDCVIQNWSPKILFAKGSVDAIKIIQKHVTVSNPQLCVNTIQNTLEVFKHVMEHVNPLSSLSSQQLRSIVNSAVVQDKVDHLKHLVDITHSPMPTPSLDTLIEATKKNAVSTLEYILVKTNQSPFNRLSEIDQLRVLRSILDSAYDSGHTRIIAICINLIRGIPDTKMKRKYSDMEMDDAPATLTQSVVHSVLGNNKLNSMIMEHVGWIHRSCLGIDDNLIIKGEQLFGNNSLLDFIKYGATEYFIKSFKSINLKHSYPPNNKLISATIAHFTPLHIPILDVLLRYPSMLLLPDTIFSPTDSKSPNAHPSPCYNLPAHQSNSSQLLTDTTIKWSQLINQLSDCTTHNWSRILDDVMQLVMVNSNSPPMTLIENDLFLIKHPLFLRKLLSFGVTFTVARKNVYPPTPPPNSEVLTKWLRNPPESILEMIQLFGQPFSQETANHVLAHSVRMNIQPVSQYLIGTYQLLNDHWLPAFCAKHGYFELYNILPQSTDNAKMMFDTIMQSDKCLMPLDILKKIDFQLLGNVGTLNSNLRFLMPSALMVCRNRVDLLLSLPHIQGNPNNNLVHIKNIHPKLISVDLLERLLADKRYQCDFDYVMSSAIEAGDRQVIAMLEANTDNRFKTNYNSAFNAAATFGDVDTIKMILDKRHLTTGHKSTLGYQIGMKTLHPDVATQVLDHYKSDGSIIDFGQLKSLFVECFNRGDIEAIEHLLKQSIDCNVKDQSFNSKLGILLFLFSHMMTPITNCKVLAHFIDKGYLDMATNKQHYLTRVIEHACENGHVDIIRLVHSRCAMPDQSISFIPNTQCIARVVERNQLSVIQYLFGDDQSPIKRSPDATLVVRMAKYARHSAFVNGNINIINFCNTIIV